MEADGIHDGDDVVGHLIALVRIGIVRFAAQTVSTAVQGNDGVTLSHEEVNPASSGPAGLEAGYDAVHKNNGRTLANDFVMDWYAC